MLVFVQGGITEEQMLKFMGANTSLSPLQAKDILEVSVVHQNYFACYHCIFLSFHFLNFLIFGFELPTMLFQDEEVGFAYLSQREACPSLYEV